MNIRQRREAKELSQGELAKLLKVHPSYVSTLENGTRNPSLETMQKIAGVLGTTVAELTTASSFDKALSAQPMRYVSGLSQTTESAWLNKSWYHQRFDGCPYFIHFIAEAEITTDRKQKHGLFFDQHFCFFEHGHADWYIDVVEIERVTKTVLRLGQQDPDFSKKIMDEYVEREDAFYAMCKNVEHANLYALSDTELVRLHDELIEITFSRNSSSSIIDGFALGTDRLLEGKIKEQYQGSVVAKEMSFPEVFSALTAPIHSSFILEAELDLFRLILNIRQSPHNKRQLIEKYRDAYFWIRNNYVDANVLTVSYFEEEIGRIESSNIDVAEELQRLSQQAARNKKEKENLLKRIPFDRETRFLITVTEDFTRWQDERKRATFFTAHYASLLLQEFSRRTALPLDVLKYLTPREVSAIFTNRPPLKLLEDRRSGCVFYWNEEGYEAVSGARVPLIKTKLLGAKGTTDIQDFRGLTASLGRAQGVVRILKSAKEVNKIQKGDILVAVMTRPDYVPAMKKAAAIITDEGGITSHAAIISRELKIPCVIGTKIATQVLHDGDVVEVNASHGSIKIISRV